MPTYIYRLTPARAEMPTSPTEEESRVIGEHFEYLCQAARARTVHMAGRTLGSDAVWGICIFDAPDDDAAQHFMRNDPGIKQGVQLGELFPFRAALWGKEPPGCFDFRELESDT